MFQSALWQTSDFKLRTNLQLLNATTLEIKTVVKKVAASSITSLQLYNAIAEDTLFFTANNGETVHYNVFRKAADGGVVSVNVPANVGDSIIQTQQITVNSVWNLNRIYAVTMLQDMNKNMIQAASSNHITATGISNLPVSSSIKIYPNPAGDKIHFGDKGGIFSIKITDVKGAIVKRELVNDNWVEVSNLISGIYFLTATNAKEVFTSKFIKE